MAGLIDTDNAVTRAIGGVVDRLVGLIPDPQARERERAAAEASILALMQASDNAQADINRVEAGSASLFVSGWRPGAGWVCVAGLAWVTVLGPVLTTLVRFWRPDFPMPAIDVETLMGLLIPMLGLGAYRTVEKSRGVASR